MPTARITKRSVEGVELPSQGKRNYLWDDQLKGFGVMVMASGARSYLVQYVLGGRAGKTRRYTIGRHGSPWTCEMARDRASDLLADIRRGIDPLETERRQRERDAEGRKDASRLGFQSYVDLFSRKYIDVGGKRGKGSGKPMRSGDDIKAVFRRDLVPVFRDKPVSAITKAEIVACLDDLVDRSMSAAIKAHKWLRKLLAWAEERGDIAASPMSNMAPPGTDGERDRVLDGRELRAVWMAAEEMTEPYRSFLKILILTGQRLREVAGMQWTEIDLETARWIIPGSRTKNKRDHLVPLSTFVVSILEDRFPEESDRKGPVFTTGGKEPKPINGFSKPKAKLDEEVAKALAKLEGETLPLIKPWVFHDLRRTFSTGGQALGFPRDHMHAAVNHAADGKRAGLARVYQLYEYEPEKVAVMAAWARHVSALIADASDNVIPLAKARA